MFLAQGDGPYGPVDSDDRYAPPEDYSSRVTDLRDEHNVPGQELPGVGTHYDEIFDDNATKPEPAATARRLADTSSNGVGAESNDETATNAQQPQQNDKEEDVDVV